MSSSYGLTVSESDDPYLANAKEALRGVNKAGVPGAYLVDLPPIMKHIPSWFPGAGFKGLASHYATVNADVVNRPFKVVQKKMANRGGDRCTLCADLFARRIPGNEDLSREEELISPNSAAISYEDSRSRYLGYLPYVNAIIKESMRWQLVSPLGFAHMSTNEYDEYFIPKGTIVIESAWSILHDPEVFEAPNEFRPELYLD